MLERYSLMKVIRNLSSLLLGALLIVAPGCHSIDDDRIPTYNVNINLTDIGMWNTYGVAGYGQYRYFIRQTGEPKNYSYGEATYTGFGGVLLIGGMDPYTNETNVPLAYDLACPVECRSDVRVKIDPNTLEAVCSVCGSRYSVCEAGGAPVGGPAFTGKPQYRLQPYVCQPSPSGGYLITRRY